MVGGLVAVGLSAGLLVDGSGSLEVVGGCLIALLGTSGGSGWLVEGSGRASGSQSLLEVLVSHGHAALLRVLGAMPSF